MEMALQALTQLWDEHTRAWELKLQQHQLGLERTDGRLDDVIERSKSTHQQLSDALIRLAILEREVPNVYHRVQTLERSPQGTTNHEEDGKSHATQEKLEKLEKRLITVDREFVKTDARTEHQKQYISDVKDQLNSLSKRVQAISTNTTDKLESIRLDCAKIEHSVAETRQRIATTEMSVSAANVRTEAQSQRTNESISTLITRIDGLDRKIDENDRSLREIRAGGQTDLLARRINDLERNMERSRADFTNAMTTQQRIDTLTSDVRHSDRRLNELERAITQGRESTNAVGRRVKKIEKQLAPSGFCCSVM